MKKRLILMLVVIGGLISINVTSLFAQEYLDSDSFHIIQYADKYYSLTQTKYVTIAKYNGGVWQAGLRTPSTGQQFVYRGGEIYLIELVSVYGTEHGHNYY